MRSSMLGHPGESLFSCQCQGCEPSPTASTESVEWHLSLCLLQVPWVLQKSNGTDAWAVWKLPPLWLSLWPNRICHGLQPFLWEILRMGQSLHSFALGLFRIPQEKEGCGWEGVKKNIQAGDFFSCLPNQLEHQGNNYPICWACISFLPFIKKVSLQLSFLVFWASPGMSEKILSYLFPFESP